MAKLPFDISRFLFYLSSGSECQRCRIGWCCTRSEKTGKNFIRQRQTFFLVAFPHTPTTHNAFSSSSMPCAAVEQTCSLLIPLFLFRIHHLQIHFLTSLPDSPHTTRSTAQSALISPPALSLFASRGSSKLKKTEPNVFPFRPAILRNHLFVTIAITIRSWLV